MTTSMKSGMTKKEADILQTFVWKLDVNNENISRWFDKLEKNCLCKSIDNNFFLNTPIDIELPPVVSRQMESVYKYEEETGGIIFCKFKFENNKRILKGEYFIEVANAVEDYYLDFKKTHSYFPEINCFEKYLVDNFNKITIDEILFPIFVHTHPSKQYDSFGGDIAWLKQRLSEEDKSFARNAKIQIGNKNILFFNALLSGSHCNSGSRILFFGDKVTPFDFEDIKANKVSEGIEVCADSLTSNEGWTLFWQFALNLGTAILEFKGTKAQQESIKKSFNDMVKTKIYFSKLNKVESTIVTIQKFNV